MKRNFGKLIVTAALCCLPLSAMAMEAMDDSTLGGVTGQAGVSIALDDVVIYMKSIADVTYIDTDGFGAVTTAGIMIDHAKETQKLITLDAILNADVYGTSEMNTIFGFNAAVVDDPATPADETVAAHAMFNKVGIIEAANMGAALAAGLVPTDGSTGNFTNGISPLTIDIGECKALSAGWTYNTAGTGGTAAFGGAIPGGSKVAGVTIGLPTVEINTYYGTEGETKTIKLVGAEVAGAAVAINNDHDFITIKKTGNSSLAILGGRLEIAPH